MATKPEQGQGENVSRIGDRICRNFEPWWGIEPLKASITMAEEVLTYPSPIKRQHSLLTLGQNVKIFKGGDTSWAVSQNCILN